MRISVPYPPVKPLGGFNGYIYILIFFFLFTKMHSLCIFLKYSKNLLYLPYFKIKPYSSHHQGSMIQLLVASSSVFYCIYVIYWLWNFIHTQFRYDIISDTDFTVFLFIVVIVMYFLYFLFIPGDTAQHCVLAFCHKCL